MELIDITDLLLTILNALNCRYNYISNIVALLKLLVFCSGIDIADFLIPLIY